MSAVVIAGLTLVAFTAIDVFLTVMHPTRRGPLSFLVARGSFSLLRGATVVTGRAGPLSSAGPLVMLAVFATWVLLFWLGYALIYVPNMGDLYYTSGVDFGDHDLMEALYLSGTSLTTVGFGDVVAETDSYRMITVLEAATGFGVMTAAITFLLSLYPRVSTQRSAARSVQGVATDAAHAAEMVRGEPFVLSVQQQLLEVTEHTERFPILFFFHSKDPDASMYTMFRGSVMTCLAAGWGVSPDQVPHSRRYAEELQQSLQRTIDHYAMRFMHGHGPDDLNRQLPAEDARQLQRRLQTAAGSTAERERDATDVLELAVFAGRCDEFLEHIANQHRHEHRPLYDIS